MIKKIQKIATLNENDLLNKTKERQYFGDMQQTLVSHYAPKKSESTCYEIQLYKINHGLFPDAMKDISKTKKKIATKTLRKHYNSEHGLL